MNPNICSGPAHLSLNTLFLPLSPPVAPAPACSYNHHHYSPPPAPIHYHCESSYVRLLYFNSTNLILCTPSHSFSTPPSLSSSSSQSSSLSSTALPPPSPKSSFVLLARYPRFIHLSHDLHFRYRSHNAPSSPRPPRVGPCSAVCYPN